MNIDRFALTDTNLPPVGPDGTPDGDAVWERAMAGFGQDDADDTAWLKRRNALLERLAERGVDVAEALPALAKAQSRLAEAVTECLRHARPEGRVALGELAVTLHQGNVDFAAMYERISRSVRRCIAMREDGRRQQRARDAAGGTGSRPRASGGRAAAAQRDPETEAARDMAAGLTGEVDAEQPERLFGDLYDRPEDPTGMADLGLDRPMAELVAEICKDFGVDGKIWAERLGLGNDAADGAGTASGQNRPEAGRRRPRGKNVVEIPARSGKSRPALFVTPPVSDATDGPAPDRPARHPPAPVAADPGRPGDPSDASGLNRQQRRAAARKSRRMGLHPPPHSGTLRHRDSGCGPP